MLAFWDRIGALQRHEDTLLNNRLQAFLITTSLLFATFSQFRDSKFWLVQSLVAAGGLVLTLVMQNILYRTGRAIEWYLDVLCRLDVLLFPVDFQPYVTRRSHKANSERTKPVTNTLAIRVPVMVAMVWLILLGWALYNWHLATAVVSVAPEHPYGLPHL